MFKHKRKKEKKWHQLQREGEGDGNSVFFLQKEKSTRGRMLGVRLI
jgi:hypothetical protein